MPKEKRDVEASLQQKGFVKDDSKHHKFYFITSQGLLTPIFTLTSHTKHIKTLGDPIINQMAKQCKMTKKEFSNFIDCHIDQSQYEKILSEQGFI